MTMTREQIQAKMRLLDLKKKRLRVLSRLAILDQQTEEIEATARGGKHRRRSSRKGGRP